MTSPHELLESSTVHDRCEGARQLSRSGSVDDIPRLVELARADPSPAVRLGAAAAVADILSRYRVGPRAAELGIERRRELFRRICSVNPGVNPGVFNMIGALGLPEGLRRIAVGLRDPRLDVRVGASVGLERLCVSAAVQGDAELERQVVELLKDGRLMPDARARVARATAAAGYRSALSVLARLKLPGADGEKVAAAREALAGHELIGPWISDGRDAGEVSAVPSLPPRFAWLGGGRAVSEDEAGWHEEALPPKEAVRHMVIRRPGKAKPEPALQWEGRTWYRASGKETLAAVERLCVPARAPKAGTEVLVKAAELALHWLPDSGAGDRARGWLLFRAGRFDELLAFMEAAVQRRKGVSPEAWYLLGEARHVAGQTDAARQAWETFLKKARPNGELVQVVKGRLK